MIPATDAKLTDEPGRLAATRRLDIFDTPQEAVFEHITQLVKLSLRVPIAAVTLIDVDRQWFKSVRGVSACETPREMSFCSVAIRARQPMVIPDATHDERFTDNALVVGPPHLRSYAGAPLLLPDGYQAGALCAVDIVPREFSPLEIQLLSNLATCVVNELELRQRASTDNLTQFMTRPAFLNRADAMLRGFREHGDSSTLAILDLDHFKQVNDRFGHDAGDETLRRVAQCCRDTLDDDVQFGRLGGEEFAIAFPNLGAERAFAALTRLRHAIAGLTFPDYPRLTVTASFGVAALNEDISNVSVWCKMADAALYAAKQAGRNRVVVSRDMRMLPADPSLQTLPFLNLLEAADLDAFTREALAHSAA